MTRDRRKLEIPYVCFIPDYKSTLFYGIPEDIEHPQEASDV